MWSFFSREQGQVRITLAKDVRAFRIRSNALEAREGGVQGVQDTHEPSGAEHQQLRAQRKTRRAHVGSRRRARAMSSSTASMGRVWNRLSR